MTDFSGLCHRLAAAVPWAAAMLLAGCATVDMPPAVADIPSQAPVRWYAPQPHNGQLPVTPAAPVKRGQPKKGSCN